MLENCTNHWWFHDRMLALCKTSMYQTFYNHIFSLDTDHNLRCSLHSWIYAYLWYTVNSPCIVRSPFCALSFHSTAEKLGRPDTKCNILPCRHCAQNVITVKTNVWITQKIQNCRPFSNIAHFVTVAMIEYLCCMIWLMLHFSQCQVSMMVADGLAPIWWQDISKAMMMATYLPISCTDLTEIGLLHSCCRIA